MKFKKVMILLLSFVALFATTWSADLMLPSTTNPGGFATSEVPQLIVIGSDDNTSAAGVRWMIGELASRTNKDGSAMRMSFYSNTETWGSASDEIVKAHKEAYVAKHELGNHTKTHPYCIEWDDVADTIIKTWATADLLANEVLPVKNALITLVGVDSTDIYGFRTPFLGFSNNTFDAMQQANVIYDCSIGEGNSQTAGAYYWPYTLDTKNSGDENYAPGLPNWWTGTKNSGNVIIGKHAGLWELPTYNYQAPSDVEAHMDTVVSYTTGGNIGGLDYNMWASASAGGFELNKAQSIATLENTFDLIYAGNRTPITIGCHSQMYIGVESSFPNISAEADRKAVFTTFLDYVKTKDNVWLVSGAQVINYCKQPVKASAFNPDDYLPENFNTQGLTKYTLTVTNGLGDGDYVEGAVKTISADAATTGKTFDKWSGDVATVADVNASITTVTMGTAAITVTATYKDNTGPDTAGLASENLVKIAGWEPIVDGYGSTVDKDTTNVVEGDSVVKVSFDIVATVEDTDGIAPDTSKWTYGSVSAYLDTNLSGVTYIKFTYKSNKDLIVSLPQTKYSDAGTSYMVTVTATSSWTTKLIAISDFAQPTWTETADSGALTLSEVDAIGFEVTNADVGGTQNIELKDVVLYNYIGTVTAISNSFTKVNIINSALISNVTSKTVSFKIPTSGIYSVKLFALNGKMVASVPAANFKAGLNRANWNSANLTKSVYLAVLEGNGVRKISKALIK